MQRLFLLILSLFFAYFCGAKPDNNANKKPAQLKPLNLTDIAEKLAEATSTLEQALYNITTVVAQKIFNVSANETGPATNDSIAEKVSNATSLAKQVVNLPSGEPSGPSLSDSMRIIDAIRAKCHGKKFPGDVCLVGIDECCNSCCKIGLLSLNQTVGHCKMDGCEKE